MGDASVLAFEARPIRRRPRDARGLLLALAAALLLHLTAVTLFIADWKRTPAPEPPVMTVELVREEPKPEPPRVEEKRELPPPPPQIRQSGGNPDKAPGQALKADQPAQPKAREEDQRVPAPPERKPEGTVTPEHKAQPKARRAPPPTKAPQEQAAAPIRTPVVSELTGEGGGDRYFNEIRDEILAKRIYPDLARALQLKGTARYEMDVDRSGKLLQVRTLNSTGIPMLDQSGVDAIIKAAPFPPVPEDISGEPVRLFLTFYLGPEPR